MFHLYIFLFLSVYDNKTGNVLFVFFCRLTGVHLLDSLDDGTEIVDPIITDEDSSSIDTPRVAEKKTVLAISGHSLTPLPAPPCTTGSPPNDNPGLHYEEIIAQSGIVEEYFAYSTE